MCLGFTSTCLSLDDNSRKSKRAVYKTVVINTTVSVIQGIKPLIYTCKRIAVVQRAVKKLGNKITPPSYTNTAALDWPT